MPGKKEVLVVSAAFSLMLLAFLASDALAIEAFCTDMGGETCNETERCSIPMVSATDTSSCCLDLCYVNCTVNSTRTCGYEMGACTKGKQTCGPDALWGVCENATLPVRERCNQIDDDCNGVIDDVPRGRCQCYGGQEPEVEVCDGADNDCDEEIDEVNCSCEEQGGYKCLRTQSCLGEYINAIGTTYCCSEPCLDPCADGSVKECGTDLGECTKGTRICTGNSWGACEGSHGPSEEVCNRLDDDCDGIVDNVYGGDSPEDNMCGCYGGSEPSEEICNGIDDDCDGLPDEDCADARNGAGIDEKGDGIGAGDATNQSQNNTAAGAGQPGESLMKKPEEVLDKSKEAVGQGVDTVVRQFDTSENDKLKYFSVGILGFLVALYSGYWLYRKRKKKKEREMIIRALKKGREGIEPAVPVEYSEDGTPIETSRYQSGTSQAPIYRGRSKGPGLDAGPKTPFEEIPAGNRNEEGVVGWLRNNEQADPVDTSPTGLQNSLGLAKKSGAGRIPDKQVPVDPLQPYADSPAGGSGQYPEASTGKKGIEHASPSDYEWAYPPLDIDGTDIQKPGKQRPEKEER